MSELNNIVRKLKLILAYKDKTGDTVRNLPLPEDMINDKDLGTLISFFEKPDIYWNADDEEFGHSEPRDVCEEYPLGEICEISNAKRLPLKYGIWVGKDGEDFKLFDDISDAERAAKEYELKGLEVIANAMYSDAIKRGEVE